MRFINVYLFAIAAVRLSPVSAQGIGTQCDTNTECDSGLCWRGLALPTSPGSCQCVIGTDAGCQGTETCWDDPAIADEPPQCVNLCDEDADCDTEYCFDDSLGQGRCECNTGTNAGCDRPTICSQSSGFPPFCSLTASDLPIDSPCWDDEDCETGSCFYGEQLFGTPGRCQCNLSNNAGCEGMETCFEDPLIADLPPFCVNLDSLLPIGEGCTDYTECATYYCFLETGDGECVCNPIINLGCDTGLVCTQTTFLDEPTCEQKRDIGAACNGDLECTSNNCFYGSPPGSTGTCQCNSNTNAGCTGDEYCDASDGVPVCKEEDGLFDTIFDMLASFIQWFIDWINSFWS